MKKRLLIGRNPNCDIRIDDPSISGQHAYMTIISNTEILLEDNNSTNGTWLNGQTILSITAYKGDTIRLGKYETKVERLLDRVFGNQSPKLSQSPTPPPFPSASTTPPPIPNVPSASGKATAQGQNKKIVDVSREFLELQQVLSDYRRIRREIKNDKNKNMTKAVISSIPFIGGPIMHLMSSRLSNEDKMEQLNDWFKKTYVCPNCKVHFGDTEWGTIANRKICGSCKAILAN